MNKYVFLKRVCAFVLVYLVLQMQNSSQIMMTVVFVVEKDALRMICGHAPLSGGSFEEEQAFYELKMSELYIVEQI